MKFVQAFAAGLRAEFADAACAPVPEYLAALMRQLDGDRNEHSGEGREYGTSSRRGCLKTANSIPSSVKAPKLPLPRC